MNLKKLILILIMTFPALGFGHRLCPGILPENDQWIGIGNKNNPNEMTEAQFNKIIDRVEEIYKPIVAAKNKKLKIIREWTNGTINAYADKFIDDLKVIMPGGMARHPEATPESFALVICHEIGHHLGGIPQSRTLFLQKVSSEGQADYWGAMKCLRKYLEKDDNATIASKLNVPEIVKEKCQANWHNENDIGICYRTALAGLALTRLFNQVKPKPNLVLDLAKPDPKVVFETSQLHPPYQCRLDTYFQAGLCDKDSNLELDIKNPDIGFCNKAEGYTEGLRPLCWFNPKDFN